MSVDVYEVKIRQVRGHWVVYINGDFFCSADSYGEAVKEAQAVYSVGMVRV